MSDETWLNVFPLLVKYKIAEIQEDKYVYSNLFEESMEAMKLKPLGRIEQMRMGIKVRKAVIPVILQHAKAYRNKRDIENLILSSVCVMYHSKRHNIGIPKDHLPPIVWGTWWLNDHEPEVDLS